jgi:hypothetical protein
MVEYIGGMVMSIGILPEVLKQDKLLKYRIPISTGYRMLRVIGEI